MMHAADLPDVLPIFPLPGALLLPRARLPLHVFEPRYLAMLDDTFKTQSRMIGLIQPQDAHGALRSTGCAGRVTSFSETEDGRYMITLTGISRYQIDEEIEGFTPYRRAKVIWRDFPQDLGKPERDPGFDFETFMTLLKRFLAVKNISADWENLKDADPEMVINSLSMLLPLSNEDKQALLETKTLQKRRETLVTLIEFALMNGRNEEVMQ